MTMMTTTCGFGVGRHWNLKCWIHNVVIKSRITFKSTVSSIDWSSKTTKKISNKTPQCWPFTKGIQQWPVDSPTKGQQCGTRFQVIKSPCQHQPWLFVLFGHATCTSWKGHYSTVHKMYISQIAKFMGPTWSQPGSCRPQMGPMLAPWTLLSGMVLLCFALLWYFICPH